jgi:predicted ATP-grasp superfamily ATP-dependent carboligase
MRVLVTGSRMPFALAIIRKLAEEGHEVLAADAWSFSPGSHSKYVTEHFVTGSPRDATEQFIDDVERIAGEQEVDVILPAFEEVFYLSTQWERLARVATPFFSPFATLLPLHDKETFERVATGMGLPMAKTVIAHSDEELREALQRFPEYFARAAFSRGGVSLLTDSGPLAGRLAVSDCHPTETNPWLVQEFIEGDTFCTYSTVHSGKVTAHCAYAIPRQWKHSTGIQFRSIDGGPTLEVIEQLVAADSYTGQVSFDFIDSPNGPYLVECNPRATDGALLMSSPQMARGLLDPDAECETVPAGEEIQLDMAVFGGIFEGGLKQAPSTLQDLMHIHGSDRGWHDALPNLYSFLALMHSERLKHSEHAELFVAMAGDLSWDGDPIPGMSDSDAKLLAAAGG